MLVFLILRRFVEAVADDDGSDGDVEEEEDQGVGCEPAEHVSPHICYALMPFCFCFCLSDFVSAVSEGKARG